MKAVKRPGSLYLSAARMSFSQAERYVSVPGSEASAGGNVPLENVSMTSVATLTASAPPFWISSYQRLPVGSARKLGIAREQLGEETHVVGVIGDDDEIERPRRA